MKPANVLRFAVPVLSPPHGGVWIETGQISVAAIAIESPPHGGVWIETDAVRGEGDGDFVTPSRGGVD